MSAPGNGSSTGSSVGRNDDTQKGSSRRRPSARPTTPRCCAGCGPSFARTGPRLLLTVLMLAPLTLVELVPALIVRDGIDLYLVPGRPTSRGRRPRGRTALRWQRARVAAFGLHGRDRTAGRGVAAAWLAGLYFLVAALGSAAAVPRHVGDVLDRAVGHARPASRGLHPHPAPASGLLRHGARRPSRDARDQRRRERGRDVLRRHRGPRARRAQDGGLRDGALPDRSLPRVARLLHHPGPRDRRCGVPASRCVRRSGPCACASRASTPTCKRT